MKIYLCGSKESKSKMAPIAQWLESDGHRVVSSWWWSEFSRDVKDRESIAALAWRAEMDDASCLIYYVADPVIMITTCVEIGYMLAQCKEIYHLGYPRPNDPFFTRYMKTWPSSPPGDVVA